MSNRLIIGANLQYTYWRLALIINRFNELTLRQHRRPSILSPSREVVQYFIKPSTLAGPRAQLISYMVIF